MNFVYFVQREKTENQVSSRPRNAVSVSGFYLSFSHQLLRFDSPRALYELKNLKAIDVDPTQKEKFALKLPIKFGIL